MDLVGRVATSSAGKSGPVGGGWWNEDLDLLFKFGSFTVLR